MRSQHRTLNLVSLPSCRFTHITHIAYPLRTLQRGRVLRHSTCTAWHIIPDPLPRKVVKSSRRLSLHDLVLSGSLQLCLAHLLSVCHLLLLLLLLLHSGSLMVLRTMSIHWGCTAYLADLVMQALHLTHLSCLPLLIQRVRVTLTIELSFEGSCLL